MKESDLRIGNWVQTRQTEKEFVIKVYHFQVPSIINSQYKPIPLTEELLVKFGFDMYERNGYISATKKFEYKSLIIEFEFERWSIKDINGNRAHGLVVDYVHQVQNWWHLISCEELEIKE